MPNVDDLLETLNGPITDQLRAREGKRISVSKPDIKRGPRAGEYEDADKRIEREEETLHTSDGDVHTKSTADAHGTVTKEELDEELNK